ncbi:hypothetical protein [Tenacibaculum singaporense]|uniref:hypothetical protein n=1 Tax=Tenacibaculum singaporense TaxID=2358479 RepID=UPI000F671F50|nr:hypothetical protein [Tenacibaculum singaporense]RSC96025.1 hypothetical protein EI424_02590 [Tenacibaculum singaporense]
MKNIEQVHEHVIKKLNKLNIDFEEVRISINITPNVVVFSIVVYVEESFESVLCVKDSEIKFLVKKFDFEADIINEKQKK